MKYKVNISYIGTFKSSFSKIVEASSAKEAREIADEEMTEAEILSGIYKYLDADAEMDVEEFSENDSK